MKASSAEIIAAKMELLDELKEVLRTQQGKRLMAKVHGKHEKKEEEEEGEEEDDSDAARLKAVAAEE